MNTKFVEVDISFSDKDKDAAWALYVEMITRVATQKLDGQKGDEKTALESIYSLFNTVRGILKENGPKSILFAKIVIPVLNQKIRPFTSKWHGIITRCDALTEAQCIEFRNELEILQLDLLNFTKLLSDMAEVEDITDLEEVK